MGTITVLWDRETGETQPEMLPGFIYRLERCSCGDERAYWKQPPERHKNQWGYHQKICTDNE